MNTPENISPEQLEKLRYPIGKMDRNVTITPEMHEDAMEDLANFPSELHAAVISLSDEQLDTPYRPGGWTVRQTVHHLADSHMNGYIRCKLALTEENPTIKPYEEHLWADLADTKTAPIELSLNILEALHRRWIICLKSLTQDQWKRTYLHPESGETSLELSLQNYAWHGEHHLTQITNLKERMEW
jgi:uncharacterized damage-inducible protein DinB